MRLFEQSVPSLRAVLGADLRVGVLLYDHFFIEASVAGGTDFQNAHWMSFTGQVGWQFNENVRLYAGASYMTSTDPMLVIPDGWAFFVGFSFRF